MSTPRIQRFDFNSLRDFRGPIVMKAATETEQAPPPPPPPPVFNEQDLESARMAGKKAGFSEGFNAGRLEAKQEADARLEEANLAIAKLSEMVSGLQQAYRQMIAHETTHLPMLVTSVARKVAGEAMDARGEEIIHAIVERALPIIFSKPKLTIDLHPDVLETAMNRIEGQLRTQGFEGELQFRSNYDLGTSDIRLDWGSGQIHRSAAELWQEIEALMQRVPLEITFAETLDATNRTGA